MKSARWCGPRGGKRGAAWVNGHGGRIRMGEGGHPSGWPWGLAGSTLGGRARVAAALCELGRVVGHGRRGAGTADTWGLAATRPGVSTGVRERVRERARRHGSGH
jgi:hypothetical protein